MRRSHGGQSTVSGVCVYGVAPPGRRTVKTLARLARHRHVAAHHARERARDGKPEPCPAVAPSGEGIGLGELLE